MATSQLSWGLNSSVSSSSCGLPVPTPGLKTFKKDQEKGRVDAARVILEEQIACYVHKLAVWPHRKQEMLAAPEWFQANYATKIKQLQKKLDDFPGQADFLQLRLVDMKRVPSFVLENAIRQKLMLRCDSRYAEFPRLVTVCSIREELELPSGLMVNPMADQCGLYTLTPEDQKIRENARKLFAVVLLEVRAGWRMELKFELDFIMSYPPYGDACRVVLDRDIIQRNIRESKKAFQKNYDDMHRTCSNFLLEEASRTRVPALSKLTSQYLPDN